MSGERKEDLSLLSWNILAPLWIDFDDYKLIKGDLNLLHVHKRLLLVIERILQFDADVVNLQEVQEDQYKIISSEIGEKYRDVAFTMHEKDYWTKDWLPEGVEVKGNGQATFYRKSKFDLVLKSELKTTEDGNMMPISLLRLKEGLNGVSEGNSTYLVVANCHLENGRSESFHNIRANQIRKIHAEIENIVNKVSQSEPKSIVHVSILGDFNCYGRCLGMKEIRKLGYIDVADIVDGPIKPTFCLLWENVDGERDIQLDHITLKKSDYDEGFIQVKSLTIPSLEDPAYDREEHQNTIIKALVNRFNRKRTTTEEMIRELMESKILQHIGPSSDDVVESHALRALRIGSDHLPLVAVLQITKH